MHLASVMETVFSVAKYIASSRCSNPPADMFSSLTFLQSSSVYDAAMPNSCGAPVLDDTRTLRGVHIGSICHLDSTHAPIKVRIKCDVWLPKYFCYQDLS